MLVAIHAKTLQTGMYIAGKGSSFAGAPPGVAEGYVASEAAKQALLDKNVLEVRVDLRRMLLACMPATPDRAQAAQARPVEVEAPAAQARPVEMQARTGLTKAQTTPMRQRHDAYLKGIEQAGKLQESGLAVARDLEKRIAAGKELPIRETKEIVRGMIASLAANRNVMLGLSRLEQGDAYTYTHCMNVALYATLLAKHMGEDDAAAEEIGVSGFFHDIGKLFVSQEIINSPDKLTSEQLKAVRKHPQYGAAYSRKISGLSDAVHLGILDHHESWGGAGYPEGKKGSAISQAGAMLHVADVYDALSSRRSYKPPMSPGDALARMYRERGDTYAPNLLESFIKAIGVYPSGCMARLSDGAIALITGQTDSSLFPQVVVLTDSRGGSSASPRLLDLSLTKQLGIVGCGRAASETIDLQKAVFAAC